MKDESAKRHIEDAERIAGSLSELSRQLGWKKGAIAMVKSGVRPLSPYRAAQLAMLMGEDEDAAIFHALKEHSKTAPEREYWEMRWKAAVRSMNQKVQAPTAKKQATGK